MSKSIGPLAINSKFRKTSNFTMSSSAVTKVLYRPTCTSRPTKIV